MKFLVALLLLASCGQGSDSSVLFARQVVHRRLLTIDGVCTQGTYTGSGTAPVNCSPYVAFSPEGEVIWALSEVSYQGTYRIHEGRIEARFATGAVPALVLFQIFSNGDLQDDFMGALWHQADVSPL